jgi:hypothetical protein
VFVGAHLSDWRVRCAAGREPPPQEWKLTATKANVSQQLRSGLWVKDGAAGDQCAHHAA